MSKRRRSSAGRRAQEAKFWGEPAGPSGDDLPGAAGGGAPAADARRGGAAARGAVSAILPTPEPGALVRSLGPPPLAIDPGVAERHLVAVYEEAVRAASALAAANGLLDTQPDED